MRRPAAPVYVLGRGGRHVDISIETRKIGAEPFIDAMRHYPPLHHVVGRRVYEVVWRPGRDVVEYVLPNGSRLRLARPSRIELRRPLAASLGALGAYRCGARSYIPRGVLPLVYAYGFIDYDEACMENCPFHEYHEESMGGASRNIRAVIVYVDPEVLARHHAARSQGVDAREVSIDDFRDSVSGRTRIRIPYYQPFVVLRNRVCIYPYEHWRYNAHPLLHEAAVVMRGDDEERRRYWNCLATLAQSAGFRLRSERGGGARWAHCSGDTENVARSLLLPQDPNLVASTPPRFYPQYRVYVIEEKPSGPAKTASLGGLRVAYSRAYARVAIVLESSRAIIRGRFVAPKIRDEANDADYGDVFDTQAVTLSFPGTLGEEASRRISLLVAADEELRSKMLYHVVYEVLRGARGLQDAHDETVQYAAIRVWRSLRIAKILGAIAGDSLDRDAIAAWSLAAGLYGILNPQAVAGSVKRSLMPSDVRRPAAAESLCTALSLVEDLTGGEALKRGSSTKERCLNEILPGIGDEGAQILEDVRSWVDGWPRGVALPPRLERMLRGFVVRSLLHTITHWLIAVHVTSMGLSEGDLEASETSADSVTIYELYEGGVGASKSIEALLGNPDAVKSLSEWITGVCLPLRVQYQLYSLLTSPEMLSKLWSSLRGSPRGSEAVILRGLLGEEPLPSVTERVAMLVADHRRLVEALTLHALVEYVREVAGIHPRPLELAALYAALVYSSTDAYRGLVRVLAERVSRRLSEAGISVDDVEGLVSSALRRIFEGRATLEELIELGGRLSDRIVSARSAALAMEEYGGLWWLDGHPICHGVTGCGRGLEERDINAPLTYLSPRLLIEATAGRL